MRGVRKADLPTRTCATCGRPFAWRKRWAKVWAEVKYCSDACRLRRPRGTDAAVGASRGVGAAIGSGGAAPAADGKRGAARGRQP
jgi:hypothetical protein